MARNTSLGEAACLEIRSCLVLVIRGSFVFQARKPRGGCLVIRRSLLELQSDHLLLSSAGQGVCHLCRQWLTPFLTQVPVRLTGNSQPVSLCTKSCSMAHIARRNMAQHGATWQLSCRSCCHGVPCCPMLRHATRANVNSRWMCS